MKVTSKTSEGKDIACFISKPTSADNTSAKLYSNSVAAKILTAKDADGKPVPFITRNQVRDILKSSGKLTPDGEKKVVGLSADIKELEDKLKKGGIKKSEARSIAFTLSDKRTELILALLEINKMDGFTLESDVENANFDYLVFACSHDEKGDRLFKSVEDYKEKQDTEDYAYDCAECLKNEIYGTTNDILRKNPEFQFLLKYKFVDDSLRCIDAEGNLITRDGQRVTEDGNLVGVEDNTFTLGEFQDDDVSDVVDISDKVVA